MPQIYLTRAAVAALLAIVCAALSAMMAAPGRGHLLVKVGGGLLAAVALFGLMPELGSSIGWPLTLLLAAAGYGMLALADARGIPVCPSCSHGEGFLTALIGAVGVHALVDGWSMVAVSSATGGMVSTAMSTAVILHKVPEGFALGALVQSSASSRFAAMALCVVAELPTVLGGALGLLTIPVSWVNYPLAVAAGTFLFLGLHAFTAKRQRPE